MWRRGSALRDSTWMRFLPFSLTNIQRFDLGRRRWWFTASMKDISTITGLEKMSQTQLIRSGRITSYLVSDTSNCLSPFKGCQMTDPKSTRITNGSLFCWMSGIKEMTCVTSVNTAVEFCHGWTFALCRSQSSGGPGDGTDERASCGFPLQKAVTHTTPLRSGGVPGRELWV